MVPSRDGKYIRAHGYQWIKFTTDSWYLQVFITRGYFNTHT